MVQARTLEAVESIEAIDALESTTLGSLEARTAKARKTVEAISVLEARMAQAMKAIEAMSANAFEAIDATVAELTPEPTPELTGILVPPHQAAQADGADAAQAPQGDEAETSAPDGADSAEPHPADAAAPGPVEGAASSGTDVARTRVIHIDEPPPSVTLTTSSTETIIAVPQPRAESLVAVAPAPATTTAPLPLVPSAEPPALPAAEPQAEPAARPRRARWSRHTRISRLLLLGILGLQAIMSLRLHNTAFEDEALYLYSGHMELEHLLHGSALQGSYTSYFSGAPVLYPVAAAFLNGLGGSAARLLSLAEMLSITALLYSLTRRLFNERVGLCAALLFSVMRVSDLPGQLRHLRRDLPVPAGLRGVDHGPHRGGFRWPVFLLAAPVAALAVGVKYAGLLFVPTIAVLPALAAWPLRGRRVLLYPPVFVAGRGRPALRGAATGRQGVHDGHPSTTTTARRAPPR